MSPENPRRPLAEEAAPRPPGRFRVLERIGSGSTADVYLAEQCEPIARRVALKVLRGGCDSAEVAARFRREAQLLGTMSHDAIARALDAGVTAEGRLFLAMEFVAGVPITTYCDAHRLPIRARLKLFVRVCAAVQHAHQRSVLHRDLKPANVLVSEETGRPLPKLIDFGIARMLQGPGSALATQCGPAQGTPGYMSPEQASGSPDVDTRADVYSLGALLHELVAGAPPRPPHERGRGAGPGSSAGPISLAVATARGSTPRGIARMLDGDLGCVLATALAPDRALRYPTPQALATDVERWLAGEPLLSRPAGAMYRFARFAGRHRVLVGGAALAVLALVGGLIASLHYLRQARASTRAELAALRDAQAGRDQAEADYGAALEAVDEMLMRVGAVDLDDVPQMEPARETLLRSALAVYERFLADRGGDPPLRARAARARHRVGWIEAKLGNGRAAVGDLAGARDAYAELRAAAPHDRGLQADAAACQADHGAACIEVGDEAAADAAFAAAIAAYEELRVAAPADPRHRRALATALAARARSQARRDPAGSKELVRRAIAELSELPSAGDAECERAVQLARARLQLANLEADTGAPAAAAGPLDAATAALEGLAARYADDTAVARTLARAHELRARLAQVGGQPDLALDLLAEALAQHERVVAAFPSTAAYRLDLAGCAANLGSVLAPRDADRALAAFERAATVLQDGTGVDLPLGHRRLLALVQANTGAVQLNRGALDDAHASLQRAIALSEQLCRDEPGYDRNVLCLAMAHNILGSLLLRRGDPTGSRASHAAALAAIAPAMARQASRADYRSELAQAGLRSAQLALQAGAPHDALAAIGRAAPVLAEAVASGRARARERAQLLELRCLEVAANGANGDCDAVLRAVHAAQPLCTSGVELFQLAVAMASCSPSAATGEARPTAGTVAAQVVAVLRSAQARGHRLAQPLGSDPRFAALHGVPGFAALAAEWEVRQ
jgi:hypothetical protein